MNKLTPNIFNGEAAPPPLHQIYLNLRSLEAVWGAQGKVDLAHTERAANQPFEHPLKVWIQKPKNAVHKIGVRN